MQPSLGSARVAVLAAVLALFFAFAPGSALANHVQCGDVITQDTTLHSDLLSCPGDGLIIGADGVRLNLAGHTIDGIDTEGTTGITSLGFNYLVVGNGNVDGFEFGLDLVTSNSTTRDITVASCCGITVGMGVSGNDNTVVHNVTTDGGGMIGVHGDRNVVSHNLIQSQTDDSYFHVSGTDIRVTHNVIGTDCVVCEGLSIGEVHGAVISHNVVTGDNGCECAGISAFSATSEDSRLAHNTVTGMGYGITVSGDFDVFHNTSSFNDYDGIQSSSPGSTLTRNTANFNGELGINAPGTIDGGGNRARGNGNPAQCVGVRCK